MSHLVRPVGAALGGPLLVLLRALLDLPVPAWVAAGVGLVVVVVVGAALVVGGVPLQRWAYRPVEDAPVGESGL